MNGRGQRNGPLKLRGKLLMLAVALGLSAALLEGGVRLLGHTDADGQFWFIVPLRPRRMPVHATERILEQYRRTERPYQVADDRLGWTINPRATGQGGMYRSNNIGIRSDRDTNLKASRFRVALFGDSFVHGDDVPLDESWAGLLEETVDAEVLNFGVGGYGNDQAYLRWLLVGQRYSPDVVIIGFQPENCRRNLNIFRKLVNPESGIPFSKPRFVLENAALRLVNTPTVPPARIPEVLSRFERWPDREHEYFYRSADYEPSWLDASKTLSALVTLVEEAERRHELETAFFEPGRAGAALCEAIVARFAREAGRKSRVALLHLPRKPNLDSLLDGEPLAYRPLLARLATDSAVIDPVEALVEAARREGLGELFALGRHHYSVVANRVVARAVAERVAEWTAR